LATNSIENVLYAFLGGSDGAQPIAGLIADKKGNLYGVSEIGGVGCGRDGCGTVFKVSPSNSKTTLYKFLGGSDGAHPSTGLVMDEEGNLYGTTPVGGNTDTCGPSHDERSGGCGIVFKIAADRTESVLHTFTGGNDGGTPSSGLIADNAGNLYGATLTGGSASDCGIGSYGCGTLFKLATNGSETFVHVFQGGNSDGAFPVGSPIADTAGNLYGTTVGGGSTDDCGAQKKGLHKIGCGTIFKLAPDGNETIIHVFTGGSDGAYPLGGVIADGAGNLYGTTGGGGSTKNCGIGAYGCGIVFKLAPDGTETILHVFTGTKKDGGYPTAGLIADEKGNLYGTTYVGGAHDCAKHTGCGIVFKLKE
jgi:uncharacterized repeat protein (TIGR03803 family)